MKSMQGRFLNLVSDELVPKLQLLETPNSMLSMATIHKRKTYMNTRSHGLAIPNQSIASIAASCRDGVGRAWRKKLTDGAKCGKNLAVCLI